MQHEGIPARRQEAGPGLPQATGHAKGCRAGRCWPLRTAAAVSEASADDASRLDHELAARQQALGRVLALLDEAATGASHADGRGPVPHD